MNTARSVTWEVAGGDPGELTGVERANLRLLAEARLALVSVAIVMALLHSYTPRHAVVLLMLLAYGVIAGRELRRSRAGLPPDALAPTHWTDLACYIPAAALTGGIASPYNVFLLFPVFTACLGRGLTRALLVALLCASFLGAAAVLSHELPAAVLVASLPLPQIALGVVLAVVIARWAHAEVTIVRRLAFCNDVSQVFTPHHDLRRAISRFCEMLCAYQRAVSCVVLLKDTRSGRWMLFEVAGGEARVRGERVDDAMAQPLLVVPADRSVLYRTRALSAARFSCTGYDAATLQPASGFDCRPVVELAQLLEAGSLVSLPLRSRDQVIGRLHLTARGVSYGRDDLQFLAQVAAQVGLLIENVRLVDRVTVDVANEERRRISRDLHDGTIQPYIGLKLALEALQRKIVADPVLAHEVDDLAKMASDGITQLRHYVGNLKSAGPQNRLDCLVPAIRRQAEKFSEYYGIATEVAAQGDPPVRGPLFDEVMHLVREGLSNIRRHTRSNSARIEVHAAEGRLRLTFTNEHEPGDRPEPFSPRALSERARELGGAVRVEIDPRGATVVSIELPL